MTRSLPLQAPSSWPQLALAILHLGLAAYMLGVAIAFPGRGNQQLYQFPNTWGNSSTIGVDCPDNEICPTGESKPTVWFYTTAALLAAELLTGCNHLITWFSLTYQASRFRGLLYDERGALHGIKLLFFIEYAGSAACMTTVIFNRYSGYLDERFPGIIASGIAVSMLIGPWIDSARWFCFRLEESSLSSQIVTRLVRVLSVCSTIAVFAFIASVWLPSMVDIFREGAPEFVKGIVFGEFVLFSSFGVAHAWFHLRSWLGFNPIQTFEGMQRLYGLEIVVFSWLSLLSKALLLVLLSAFVYFD